MHGLSTKTLCPALLLRFSAPTGARTSRRGWKRCRPRATPSDAIVGTVSPTMLSPGGRHPLQHHAAGSALSRRLVGDQQRLWSLLAHLGRRIGTAGGRSAPGRLVRNPSRRYASHDAGHGRRRRGNLRLRSLAIALRHPDGVPERVMREALDCPVDRLESGWATHAVLLADEGEAAYLPHGPWPRSGIRPVVAGRLLLGKSSPTRRPGNRTGVHCSPLGGTAAARVEGWAEPVGATTLACAAPQLRRTRAASSSPPASTCW